MGEITIKCRSEDVSDGYHTISELYDHRIALFIALMVVRDDISWRSLFHADGSSVDGWFIAGMHLPTGDITYHLPMKYWSDLSAIQELHLGREWDGHTSADVVDNLLEWALSK